MTMVSTPLMVERVYHAHAHKVWSALTDPAKMKQWYFDLADFKPEVGFQFQFNAQSEGVTYVHLCEVTEVVPGKKLSYTWRYRDYPGLSTVTFELVPEGDTTRVKLTHSGLESFPDNMNDFKRSSFEAGWTAIIGTQLKEFVERKQEAGDKN